MSFISRISCRIKPIRWFKATSRRKFLSCLLSLLILLTSIRFLIFRPSQVLAADVYIGFNEGYGTSANDSNSTVPAGTIVNAIWSTEDLCKFGKCLFFNGTGDYVSYSDNSNLDMSASDNVTIELWFRTPDITSGTRTLISKEEPTGADGGYRIQMNSGGQIVFGVDNDNNNYPLYFVTSPASYDDNKWHHLAAVKSGTSSLTLYIDAQSVGTTSITSTDASNNDTFYIGIYNGSSDGFTGFIDEVKIMRSARTAAQVKTDFLSETPSRGTSAALSPTQDWISNGLVGYWKLDESSGNASDSSGNTTTLTNVNTTSFVGGKFGNGADLESTSSQYFYASDNPTLSITGSLTLSAWIRPESVGAGLYNIIAKWDGTNESFRLAQNGDEIRLELDSSGNYIETTSTNLTAASTWYHIVGIYDSSQGTAKIYINGLEAATTTSGTIPSSIGDDAGRFHIGAEDSTTSAANFYDGIIDEARVYNRAFSPSEVAKLYEWAPGPVGWWSMDEGSGTSVNDLSGKGYNGTIYGNTRFKAGKFGSALYFDGTEEYNGITNDTHMVLPTDIYDSLDRITISLWFKPDDQPTGDDYQDIFVWQNLSGWDAGKSFEIGYEENNNRMQIWSSFQGDCNDFTANSPSFPAGSENQWHHLAFVLDSTGNKLYIDGVRQNLTYTQGDSSTTCNLQIISDQGTTYYTFACMYGVVEYCNGGEMYEGLIDEIKIYNYSRTPAQIIEDMNAGHPAPGSPLGSYTARWKMDDLAGTSAKDSSVSNLNLTLSSASWTLDGKFGGAWNGTGSNFLAISDTNSADKLDPLDNEDFSITLWVKSDSATNPLATETLVDKRLAGAGYDIWFNTSGQITCGIDDDAIGFPEDSATTSEDFYDANWHYIACVRNTAQDKLYLFVDGRLAAQDTDLLATGSLDNNANFVLGDSDVSDNGDEFFGDIDEVKFFKFALSPSQILIDLNQGSSLTLGKVDDLDEEGFNLPNPVGWWKMDEGGGTSITDSSGNNNNSTTWTGQTSFINAKYGSGLLFDGTNDVVRIAESPSLDLGSINDSYTISSWIKTNASYSTSGTVVTKNAGGGTAYPFALFILASTNLPCFAINDVSVTVTTCGTSAVNDGNWHHLVGIRNTSTDTIYLYVDGFLANSTSDTTTSTLSNDVDVSIGNGGISYIAFDFNGIIDEVRIYNTALSSSQVEYLYNRGLPITWYKFDECSGTISYNSSTNANGQAIGINATINIGSSGSNTSPGTCTSGSSSHAWYNGASGKFNSSLDFDGTDDYVQTSDDDRLDFQDSQDFSIEAWINRDSFTSDDTIIAKKNDQTNGRGYLLYIDDVNDDINFVVADGTDSFSVNGRRSITATGWHHIVAVFDENSTSGTTIYVDGEEDKESVSGILANVNSLVNSYNLRIGSESDAGEPFDGKIDNVKIYNYALSSTQIKRLYNEGSSVRFGPKEGSP